MPRLNLTSQKPYTTKIKVNNSLTKTKLFFHNYGDSCIFQPYFLTILCFLPEPFHVLRIPNCAGPHTVSFLCLKAPVSISEFLRSFYSSFNFCTVVYTFLCFTKWSLKSRDKRYRKTFTLVFISFYLDVVVTEA